MWCADPEEVEEIMQQHPQRINPALLAAISSEIDHMQSRGNAKAVRRLEQLQQMAANWIALHASPSLGLAEGSPSSESSGDAAGFVRAIMQLIAQVEGDRVQVHDFFRLNVEKLNESLLLDLPKVFAELIQKIDQSKIAVLFGSFGDSIQQFPLGQRWLNLEMAISANKLALQVYSQKIFPEDWAATQNSLANAYRNRIRGEKEDNLERAIAAYQCALQIYTRVAFPEQWAMMQTNLAASYRNRIQGERGDNIEQAIAAYQLALEVRTRAAFPEEWAATQNNLAIAYSDRIRGERGDNIEQAIAAYQLALEVRTRAAFPEEWAATQNSLANAYRERTQGEQAENIEQAINACELALEVRIRAAFPEEWAATQNSLANAYSKRIRGEREHNLEQAINGYEQSLQEYTREAFPEKWAMTQNNLALAYSDRICGERASNLEQAINGYEQSLQVYTPDAFPQECRNTAKSLGILHFQENNWTATVAAYNLALNAAETLYQTSISLTGKGDELKATGTIPHHLAYAQAQLGNRQQAVLILEQSRARGLSESLNRDRANLTEIQSTHLSLYSQYQDITYQLRNIEAQQRDRLVSTDRHTRTPASLRDTATKLRSDLEETIAQIRQVPTYEDFLTPIKWEDIQKAVTIECPLVYLVTTPNGTMVLTVTVDSSDVLWLDSLTNEFLQKLFIGSGDIENLDGGWFVDYIQASTNRQSWHNTIDTTTRQLWDLLMSQIVDHLKTKGFDRATLIPTGYLSHLPLHASWTEDPTRPTGRRYALDAIRFTYSPNARSLTAAREITNRAQTDSILVIDNPTQDLPHSKREIDCAINSFGDCAVLRHDTATIEAVKSGLTEAVVVHFSCHGAANLDAPLNSGLVMSNGLLTLKDLLDLNLAKGAGIRLAILSACETGLPGLENIDEVVSLPVGLMQAGVAGIIASLWSVSDLSTMLLLTKFYELWREQHLPADQALRQAQIWLRDSTNDEKVIECKNAIDRTRMSPATAQQLYDELAWETKTERSFAHPFHWAAFSYTGI